MGALVVFTNTLSSMEARQQNGKHYFLIPATSSVYSVVFINEW